MNSISPQLLSVSDPEYLSLSCANAVVTADQTYFDKKYSDALKVASDNSALVLDLIKHSLQNAGAFNPVNLLVPIGSCLERDPTEDDLSFQVRVGATQP